jgi:hypothetical protein
MIYPNNNLSNGVLTQNILCNIIPIINNNIKEHIYFLLLKNKIFIIKAPINVNNTSNIGILNIL